MNYLIKNHINKILFVVILSLICIVPNYAWQFSSLAHQPSKDKSTAKLLYTQKQYWFSQIIDHFNYLNTQKWNQRYYVIQDFFDPTVGPVILYICGESICNGIRDTRNWPALIAQQTKGLILSLQHRYYGQSMPFGNSSLEWNNLKYLTAEQALKDLSYFLMTMTDLGMYGITTKTPWITIGGSYPGALAAWFRYKYPHLTVGSIASSAVVLAIEDFHQFDQQIYASSTKSGSFCSDAIKAVSQYAENQVLSDNRIAFQAQFKAQLLTAREFLFYWSDVMVLKIQYGGRSDFCNSLKGKTLEQQFNVVKAIALTVTPVDYGAIYLKNVTFANQDGRGARAWIYQSCTQFSYFQTPSKVHPMRSKLLTIDFYRAWCQNIFGQGVWPYVNRVNTHFGGLNLDTFNLIMSNGDQDPWRWASLQTSKGKIISKIANCDNCAHCQDFHNPTDKDPKSLVDLRNIQMTNIKQWIADHWKIKQSIEQN